LIDQITKVKDQVQAELDSAAKARGLSFDAQAQLDALRQQDPNYQKFVQEAAAMSVKETALINLLNGTNQRILGLTDALNKQLSTLSDYSSELRSVLPGFDNEIRGRIADMRRSAVQRLNYYHYLLAKAYEYQLLKPYNESLLLQPVYDRMEALAKTDQLALTQSDVKTLMEPYYSQLKSMAQKILAEFESQPLEAKRPNILAHRR
jgi:hypothetical protein